MSEPANVVVDRWGELAGGADPLSELLRAEDEPAAAEGEARAPQPVVVLVLSFFALAVALSIVTLIVGAVIKALVNSPGFWQWAYVFFVVGTASH